MKTAFKVTVPLIPLMGLLSTHPITKAESQVTHETKAIIEELIAENITFGVAIGVVSGKGTEIYCVGNTAMKGGVRIDKTTVFQLGSVTKVFTGILIADQVLRKKISLDDPVEKYLPANVTLPERNGTKIRLIDLVTHSSGLPVRPSDYHIMENAPYSTSQLYRFLSTVRLDTDIGTTFGYSSLGAALVGHVVSFLENKPYREVLRENIFDPLGMNSTDIVLTEDMQKRVSKGHDQRKESKWLEIPDVFSPSGAINTTAADMVKFIQAGLGITKSPIHDAIIQSQKQRKSYDVGEEESLGLGMFWMHEQAIGHTFIGHAGDTFGFSAYVGFDENHNRGVVVLSNGKMGVREIGVHILSGGGYPLTKKNILSGYYEEKD